MIQLKGFAPHSETADRERPARTVRCSQSVKPELRKVTGCAGGFRPTAYRIGSRPPVASQEMSDPQNAFVTGTVAVAMRDTLGGTLIS
jgi:hypothetical protein